MHDWQSLSHVRWECKYHVVIIPKYRKRVFYGKLRRQIGGILRDLCRQRGVELVEGHCMPDHVHLLFTPSATTSLEKAMQFIKGARSHRIRKVRNQKMEIWQVGFYDWTIRDADDWRTKIEYIHTNPVRAKLVERPDDWPYSSANGEFSVDPTPDKYLQLSSGAKAQTTAPLAQGLKPLPPKDDRNIKGGSPQAKVARA